MLKFYKQPFCLFFAKALEHLAWEVLSAIFNQYYHAEENSHY